MLAAFFSGFALSLSFILPIGAQNSFLLKQGLKGEFVFLCCLIFALSDAVLISLGVAGLGIAASKHDLILHIAKYGGAAFLGIYAVFSFKSAFFPKQKAKFEHDNYGKNTQNTATETSAIRNAGSAVCEQNAAVNQNYQQNYQPKTALKIALLALSFTWLNPHVYLDTLLLLGSISLKFRPFEWIFAAGAVRASISFFFIFGYASRLLLPLFKKPISWRVLDFLVGLIMTILALNLIFKFQI